MSKLTEIVQFGMILLLECWFSSSCSDGGTTAAITLNITCDNNLYLYVDGKYLGGGATNASQKDFRTYKIMSRSHVVALHCTASTPPWKGGILGSFENGLVTDTSWKCTTTAEYGWNMISYRDDDWPMAIHHGANSDSTLPWGSISSIDKNAVWIWSNDNENDSEVFCRHKLVEECTEEKQSYFQTPESIQDIAIQGFLLHQVKVASVTECGLKCGQNSACVSFTVQSSDIRGSRLCELHNVTIESHPQNVIRKEGYQYHEVVQIFH
ncbi:uncharacterized protein LOC111328634 [Stylophora pistillata]|uniref:uncharacterized protein LOC111328634 n=1 Tax=Stylophora pistillata TaxID=50429 RepID=UPI000C04AEB3|nr:uncharacterized protein LOC111328634 [Stylophora pistillata]